MNTRSARRSLSDIERLANIWSKVSVNAKHVSGAILSIRLRMCDLVLKGFDEQMKRVRRRVGAHYRNFFGRIATSGQVASPCFPVLKLSRYPLSFAAAFAALPSISEIPFLD
jgi:hypothetical protein